MFKYFLIIFLLISLHSVSDEKSLSFKTINMNYLMNTSIAGKKILLDLDKKNKLKIEEFKKIENELLKSKEKILAQKNILNENDFKNKIQAHQLKVNEYQQKKIKDMDEIKTYKLELSNKLVKEIDKILIEYSQKNSIDVILKKEAILISKKNLDITNSILQELDKKVKKIN